MTLQEFAKSLLFHGLESIGKYYSSYRAYVVENEDPDNMGRIKVMIPTLTDDKVHPKWAWPKNQFSGNNYGFQVLPMKGDIVWVEFENGNTRFPLWSHGHFTIGEKPLEFYSPQVYGFKSPKGQIIIIDDRDDIERIIINGGENVGLVKVIELTEMLNKIETKINDFLTHYRIHKVIDPLSGFAGPLNPTNPAPVNVETTEQSYIENEKIYH